ncbi:unnamed protein product [Aspergillus oryzae]|nr:unnamed protein product [Aspergillus oryzae]GMF84174.1 unnamed protein product [Aspergillus oryzae]
MPELTSERISSVVDMERPIASTPPPKSFEDFVVNPRQQVGAEIFRRGLVPCILQSRLPIPQRTRYLEVKTSFLKVAHAVGLAECLDSQGIRYKEHIVDGAHHAFDIDANTGDDIHLNVMLPAVDWIAGVINHH